MYKVVERERREIMKREGEKDKLREYLSKMCIHGYAILK